ncbi:MAG: DUF1861 family protein [Candidatus Saccharimonadales bacterium]
MREFSTAPGNHGFPIRTGSFEPTTEEIATYGTTLLENPRLLPKPDDVPDDYIAYNPSPIWTVRDNNGVSRDIMYVRVEPNRSNSQVSHLGKSVVRPYIVDLGNPAKQLIPYDRAQEYVGEDASLTRINRRLPLSGILEKVWLLSYVDPKPKFDKPNEVAEIRTRFWAGTDLAKLEHVADGPEWMKDIRPTKADGPLGTELGVYGRPQTEPDSGNITYATLPNIEALAPETIADMPYIDKDLLPVGSGVWGGVNDVWRIAPGKFILAGHRAWRTGVDGHGRHYESVLYGHNTFAKRIVELGIIATADMFSGGIVKDDTSVNLSDVVFTGGGYNGRPDFMTFGVSDGNIGVGAVRYIRRPLSA